MSLSIEVSLKLFIIAVVEFQGKFTKPKGFHPRAL